MLALHKTVVLVGMMGAGKTAVGGALSRLLRVGMFDTDEEIVSAAQMPISEIFARDGELFFREREAAVLARLLRGAPCVLSTGGGIFQSEANRALIHKEGISVWLKADIELLWQRVRHKTTRPLLQTENPKATLTEIYGKRQSNYALADLTVESQAELSVDQMAERVYQALLDRPDVLEGRDDGC